MAVQTLGVLRSVLIVFSGLIYFGLFPYQGCMDFLIFSPSRIVALVKQVEKNGAKGDTQQ